ncbi:MAG: hypothetical protein A3D67_00155 [Candidatus Lloydbacteria bacterium RIFCSPHIGHO2_02_FULL_51_22]|uniref:Uncharacterized protein n=1 Tax=Candidatus Lloydbacteria bacterium RIFCSPHIGHO2_02_FULL_51_22 TaxID=1798663 RepID=A0A1G2DDF1_9BACT|nr:MAG: hypothetical protein A3D67_00155 [Candidatus Lloydbacteria bacterium RIFCSPHIGHO2_02_FULL_51_22]
MHTFVHGEALAQERHRPPAAVDHGGTRVLFFHDTRRKRVSVPGPPPTFGGQQAAAPVPSKLPWIGINWSQWAVWP